MKRSSENRFHIQPLFYTALLFITGIILSFYIPMEKEWMVLTIPVVLLSMFILFRNKSVLTVIVLLLVSALGYERGYNSLYREETNNTRSIQPERITALAGRVVKRLEKADGPVSVILETDSLLSGGIWIPAHIKVRINDKSFRLKYTGQRAWIYKSPGRFPTSANPGMFNARFYYDMHNIPLRLTLKAGDSLRVMKADSSAAGGLIRNARLAVSGILDHNLSPPASAFMHALLLGSKQNIDREVIGNFQRTGIIHVLAISGLHVGFIVLFLYTLLSLMQIPETFRLLITTAALIFFAAIVEFKAPVMRASLMIVLYLLAQKIHRPVKPLQLLGMAALVLLIYNPRELFLPGFQFSFAAVWGLLYGTRQLDPLLPRFRGASPVKRFLNTYIRQPLIASFCAVLATTPLTWYYYGVIQVGAIFFNILVIPVIGVIVLLGIFLLLASTLPLMPVEGLASILNFLISGFNSLVAYAARWPVFQIRTGQPVLIKVIMLLLLIMAIFQISEKRWRRTGLIVFFLLLFPFGFEMSEPQLCVTFLDVGQGDACYIEFPDGENMLVDAGDGGSRFNAGSWYIEPFFRSRGIDRLTYALITHPHDDHLGGLAYLLDRIEVDTLVINEMAVKSGLYRRLMEKASRHHLVVRHWQRGTRRHIGGCALYVLHPTDTDEHRVDPHGRELNNSSIVFRLLYGKTAFLFTGDAEIPAETKMKGFGSFLRSDVLKVGHHGSRTSTGRDFLDQVSPRLAVISVGRKNKFNHPSPVTLARLSRRGTRVLRTDRIGAVIVHSDGDSVQLKRWH